MRDKSSKLIGYISILFIMIISCVLINVKTTDAANGATKKMSLYIIWNKR